MAAVDESMDFSTASVDSSFDMENYNPNQKANNKATKSTKAPVAKKAAAGGSNNKSKKTVEETYQKKTQLEHILLRPDTYIGSTESVTQPMFILNSETNRIHQKEVTYTPGLYKIFDEILVNAADNKQRDPNMDRMECIVDAATNTISVLNNGKGIPVVMHKEHKCYVPTLIFGHLLTGSNFDDDEKKTTGGRNGYGAKLANIFSTEFIVECLDTEQEKKFVQVFRNNMHVAEEPTVNKATKSELKKGDYTKITFKPDLQRFGMSTLDNDTIGLLSKRAYDIAGSMANKDGKKLSVYLNGAKVPVKDFKSYLSLFDGITPPAAYETIDDRWEVGVGVSDGSFSSLLCLFGSRLLRLLLRSTSHFDCIHFLPLRALVGFLLWICNYWLPFVQTKLTNRITLLATSFILLLQLRLSKEILTTTLVSTMDTDINQLQCSLSMIVVCLFDLRLASKLLTLGNNIGNRIIIGK